MRRYAQVCISVMKLATSAYEHCTDHQNYAYKALALTVETGLGYHEKTFSNAQRKERKNHSHTFKVYNRLSSLSTATCIPISRVSGWNRPSMYTINSNTKSCTRILDSFCLRPQLHCMHCKMSYYYTVGLN